MSVSVRASIPHDMEVELNAYSPLVRSLLFYRGIVTKEDAGHFLAPDYIRDTFDPHLLPGMEAALLRIEHAIGKNEPIAIWADYDCDGLPAAVILSDAFRKIGFSNFVTYVPHRVREGFGMNAEGIDSLKQKGASLIITVDCGVADVEAVAHANSLGIDVIITDHHMPHEVLPDAVAIVNPKLSTNQYPDDRLCGAGVAFKLACALFKKYGVAEGHEKWLLDMAGMATIADMVPLLGENRALASFGLVVMRKTRRPGLQALMRLLRLDQRTLSEEDLSFSIVPRINAASRMGTPEDALSLLSTTDLAEAGALARHLDRINNERKGTVAAMVKEAKKRLASLAEVRPVIVIGNPEWKPSLLGLVAQSLSQEFKRPAFVWGREESVVVKGSARSDGKANIIRLLDGARDVLLEGGGHAFSGGFSVLPEQVHLLEDALCKAHTLPENHLADNGLLVDGQLSLADANEQFIRSIDSLAPFGEGNPKPLFLFEGVTVKDLRAFGKGGDHLELSLSKDAASRKAIAFFKTPEQFAKAPASGSKVDVIGYIERSNFGGGGIRLRLVECL